MFPNIETIPQKHVKNSGEFKTVNYIVVLTIHH